MDERIKLQFWAIMRGEKRGIGPSIVVLILFGFSGLYGLFIWVRNLLFTIKVLSAQKFSIPVISVGNIVVGGAGKTPIVIWLLELLKEKGLKAVVLTRGYMDNDPTGKKLFSDEAEVIKQMVPDAQVVVGAERFKCGQEYLKTNKADVFILDDGFQHRQINRDLDLVAVDATNPWGNGSLLPSGLLREPISSLKRAQVVILTKTDLMEKDSADAFKSVENVNSEMLICRGVHKPVGFFDVRAGTWHKEDLIDGKIVGYFCSIADPRSFKRTLEHLGACVLKGFDFIDHHSYVDEDFKNINTGCNVEKIKILVTTRKDAVKIGAYLKFLASDIQILVLDIRFNIPEGKEQLVARIDSLFIH
ncbi:MAG: tetraacyldisaccharide 4'-kinase [Candidatus Omnitrophica bacterium]|nr:tetraacyldisaccharide 4'-kinase [Candidatus Omnitrophota bacterium]